MWLVLEGLLTLILHQQGKRVKVSKNKNEFKENYSTGMYMTIKKFVLKLLILNIEHARNNGYLLNHRLIDIRKGNKLTTLLLSMLQL